MHPRCVLATTKRVRAGDFIYNNTIAMKKTIITGIVSAVLLLCQSCQTQDASVTINGHTFPVENASMTFSTEYGWAVADIQLQEEIPSQSPFTLFLNKSVLSSPASFKEGQTFDKSSVCQMTDNNLTSSVQGSSEGMRTLALNGGSHASKGKLTELAYKSDAIEGESDNADERLRQTNQSGNTRSGYYFQEDGSSQGTYNCEDEVDNDATYTPDRGSGSELSIDNILNSESPQAKSHGDLGDLKPSDIGLSDDIDEVLPGEEGKYPIPEDDENDPTSDAYKRKHGEMVEEEEEKDEPTTYPVILGHPHLHPLLGLLGTSEISSGSMRVMEATGEDVSIRFDNVTFNFKSKVVTLNGTILFVFY